MVQVAFKLGHLGKVSRNGDKEGGSCDGLWNGREDRGENSFLDE